MTLTDFAPLVVSFFHIVAALAVTVDAVFRKRHVQSVIGWTGLAWMVPLGGAILYLCFGINRIHRAGIAIGLEKSWSKDGLRDIQPVPADAEIATCHATFAGLIRLSAQITRNPLVKGNRIGPLVDGDEAFPAMLAAIDGAQRSVTLLSYIFDNDDVGRMFLHALQRAMLRGVPVRVLIDGVGARYTRPDMVRELRKAGVRAEAFLPTRVPRLFRYANLRNHRKILVVDGQVGFTGGMNIRAGHLLGLRPAYPLSCLHFRVEGPVVADMQRAFAIDWAFATGEQLNGEAWFPLLAERGMIAARGIPDGPDGDLDNMLQILLGALSVAQHRVRIVTPYFVPDDVLLSALKVTALRGVVVDIILPLRSNIPVVDWATRPLLADLIDKGCRIYFSSPLFDHSKVFLVDGVWSLIGSTNWDARSLRLNFEYNLECYDRTLAAKLDALIDARLASAQRISAEELRRRPFFVRLRDGLARLLSPYL
jgi:cardiolipin synthase